ncbi:MAG: tRNA-dihydrouridine synthase 3 [Thelocarpon superellum]|nr:MAG: tRNA-dihydrouridine synthase 3 [Thelocarpon superellum]
MSGTPDADQGPPGEPPAPVFLSESPRAHKENVLAPLEDLLVTKPEKSKDGGRASGAFLDEAPFESPAKRIKLAEHEAPTIEKGHIIPRQKGVAQVKAEYLLYPMTSKPSSTPLESADDAAEAAHHTGARGNDTSGKQGGKARGQNKGRAFGSSRDAIELCSSRSRSNELSPTECRYGTTCRYEHNLRRYLADGKRADLTTFNGLCPLWDAQGICEMGWKCRLLGSHMEEQERDGVKELVLVEDEERKRARAQSRESTEGVGIVNVIGTHQKTALMKRQVKTEKADQYAAWLEKVGQELIEHLHGKKRDDTDESRNGEAASVPDTAEDRKRQQDTRAAYTEAPFLPSEKRRVYFGPETPILAPLTTQGNLPFRRLCMDLGAQLTYSEMAMSLPLIQGNKSEWALLKAHESETTPPRFGGKGRIVAGYDGSKDLKFGAQIAGNKPWQVLKATEILTTLCPHLRVIDLNCGCPIDLIYRAGAGSALLENPAKLEKMLRGMNAVSGEVPITVKIRMGTKNDRPMALKLVERLAVGGYEAHALGEGPAGVAAVTLHGRSRQQRYTKSADWEYISECAALIKRFHQDGDQAADTVREADARDLPAGQGGKIAFIGNGDCFSHVDYNSHLEHAKVDSIMLARGALIKPWIFEEIAQNQYLDKSATERLAYVERYAKYGLQTWGSDEMGVGTTRRFLLEWLSFTYRYVPLGILEHLPPSIQDRPPAWKGRNELETLLGSGNYKDWIKISEMFLGPAHKDFKFEPKHRSNSYEIEAEG